MVNRTVFEKKKKKAYQQFVNEQFDSAKSSYQELAKTNSKDNEVLFYLASASLKTGDLLLAKKCIDKVTSSCTNSKAFVLKGKIEYFIGDIDSSIKSFTSAANVDKASDEPLFCLGNIYREKSEYENAIAYYSKALSLNDNNLYVLTNLGALLHTQGRDQEARAYLERAYKIDNNNPYVLSNLAEIELFYDKYDSALQLAKKAESIDDGFFDPKFSIGRIYKALGNYDMAMSYYHKAKTIKPDDTELISSLAELHEIRNELDEAGDLLRPFIDCGQATPLMHKINASILRNNGEIDSAIDELVNIDHDQASDSEVIGINFELGKLYDKSENYQSAFSSYHYANEKIKSIRSQIINNATINDVEPLCDRLKNLSSEYWRSLPDSKNNTVPIFIVGMPRSGTTLTEHILASHSEVYGAGELPTIANISEKFLTKYNRPFPEYFQSLDIRLLDECANQYADEINSKSDGELHVVDKMPTNFRYIGLILKLFPRSKVIHIKRNPLDTCLSIYFQQFSIPSVPYSCDIKDIFCYYTSYLELMGYWNAVLGDSIYNIEYEALIREPERSISGMLEFCGLEFQDSCVNHTKTKRDINTPSYYQVRQPLYDRSINRWLKYEPYISEYLRDYMHFAVKS